MPKIEILACEQCSKHFLRALTGEPAKYCSKPCRNRAYYLQNGGANRSRRSKSNEKKARKTYDRSAYYEEYNRRPEVRERNRLRARANYVPTPRSRNPFAKRVWTDEATGPYTGHAWLDAARWAVAWNGVDPSAPWADDRYDEMGEALLALLENRDMNEAIREHRKREFIPRHMTVRISDMGQTEREQGDRFDSIMPPVESAEDEVMAREEVRYRYHHGENRRHSKARQQQPSRRRMKDAGINDKRPRSPIAGAGA